MDTTERAVSERNLIKSSSGRIHSKSFSRNFDSQAIPNRKVRAIMTEIG